MPVPTWMQVAISAPFLIAYLCVTGSDPLARATYHVGSPWGGVHFSKTGPDRTFSLLGTLPVILAMLTILAERNNGTICAFRLPPLESWYLVLAPVFVVYMVGTIFFGPIVYAPRSLRITGENSFTRPWSLVAYDWVVNKPMSLATGTVFKTAYVGLAGAVLWLLGRLGLNPFSESFVSPALVTAWIIVSLGRLSGLMLTFRLSPPARTCAYLVFMPCLAFAWWHAELLLRTCGVPAGVIPYYTSIH